MGKLEEMEDRQFIFGSLLFTANRMDTLLERELKEFDITSKQWMLSIIIDNLFDSPPTLKDVAKEMGSSHQNVKQVALKLEQKGLLKMQKDKKDARVTRLNMTDESYQFWAKTQPKGTAFVEEVFENITKDELTEARNVMNKIMENLIKME
ncbi:MAG: winged helix DNA-binding protein [Peptostreptococcaceae bacterium]|nr:winged helix DNA-binding protein [Peptostreptococcaceae bacterium]